MEPIVTADWLQSFDSDYESSGLMTPNDRRAPVQPGSCRAVKRNAYVNKRGIPMGCLFAVLR